MSQARRHAPPSRGPRLRHEITPDLATIGGAPTSELEVALTEVRRAIPDLEDWEFRASVETADGASLDSDRIVGEVRAWREVRGQLPNPESGFARLLRQILPAMPMPERSNVEAILAQIAAARGRSRLEPAEDDSRFAYELKRAVSRLRANENYFPILADIAAEHEPQIDPRTLGYRLESEPALRELIPWTRRGRRPPGSPS
jgi:hypothetical protein